MAFRVTSSIRCCLQRRIPEYGWNITAGCSHLVHGCLAMIFGTFCLFVGAIPHKAQKLSDRLGGLIADRTITNIVLITVMEMLWKSFGVFPFFVRDVVMPVNSPIEMPAFPVICIPSFDLARKPDIDITSVPDVYPQFLFKVFCKLDNVRELNFSDLGCFRFEFTGSPLMPLLSILFPLQGDPA